jgi:phage shock protein B
MMDFWWSCFDTGTLAVLLIFGTPFIAVAGAVLIKALRVVTGTPSRREQKRLLDDEAKQMQELYQGLVAMERRIEALETLLLDRERKEDYQ